VVREESLERERGEFGVDVERFREGKCLKEMEVVWGYHVCQSSGIVGSLVVIVRRRFKSPDLDKFARKKRKTWGGGTLP